MGLKKFKGFGSWDNIGTFFLPSCTKAFVDFSKILKIKKGTDWILGQDYPLNDAINQLKFSRTPQNPRTSQEKKNIPFAK